MIISGVSGSATSAPIAARHYLQVIDSNFDRASQRGTESGTVAAQNQAQQPTARFGKKSQETQKAPETQGFLLVSATECFSVHPSAVPPRGVEPLFSD
jgi:hypothetical protein